MFTLSVRRRDLAWGVALIVLLTTIWIARSDLADAGVDPPGEGIAVVYVTSGLGFPDALGVGPGAALDGAPIILVPPTGALDADTIAELERLDPKTVIIVGGTSSVSAATMTDIQNLLPNADVTRISGTNRYKTNAAFSAATYPIEGWVSLNPSAFTASGPDAEVVFISNFVSNSTTGNLFAPVQLPHGATILELRAEAVDTDPSIDLTVLLRSSTSAGTSTLATVSTTTGAGVQLLSDTTIALAGIYVVNNELYTLSVAVSGADGDPRLYSVRVRYSLGVSTG